MPSRGFYAIISSMLPIVIAPQNVLSTKAEKIERITPTILSLINEMKETLITTKDPEGVGLAAPQVGKSLQIFLMKPTRESKITVVVNPEILNVDMNTNPEISSKTKKSKSRKLEGCLSLIHIWGFVHRYPIITMRYMDEKGKTKEKKFTGFQAVIIQHEYDHLQGILFPKRVLEQGEKLYKSVKNEKGEDVFEELDL